MGNIGTVFFVQSPDKQWIFIYQFMKADGYLPIMEQEG